MPLRDYGAMDDWQNSKKRISVKVSKDTKGVYWPTFEIWFFHVSLLSWNKLFKDLGPLNKDEHHSNLYPGEGSLQFTPDLLTLLQNDMIRHGIRTNDSFRKGRGSRRDLQRNDPHLPKSFSSEWKSKPKITWATGEKNERDPGCVSTVPGSGNFHGFLMKIIPHINGVCSFFIPGKPGGPVFSLLAWSQGILKKDFTTFRQDRNAMAAMVETTGGSHGLPLNIRLHW